MPGEGLGAKESEAAIPPPLLELKSDGEGETDGLRVSEFLWLEDSRCCPQKLIVMPKESGITNMIFVSKF